MAPPTSLEALWQQSKAVIHAEVEGCAAPTTLQSSIAVVRFCTLRIIEVLKTDTGVASTPVIRVMQYGGTIDRGGEELSTNYLEARLLPHEQYVLFLQKPQSIDAYTIAFADGGLYSLDKSTDLIRIPDIARKRISSLSDRTGIPKDDFIATLRGMRGR